MNGTSISRRGDDGEDQDRNTQSSKNDGRKTSNVQGKNCEGQGPSEKQDFVESQGQGESGSQDRTP